MGLERTSKSSFAWVCLHKPGEVGGVELCLSQRSGRRTGEREDTVGYYGRDRPINALPLVLILKHTLPQRLLPRVSLRFLSFRFCTRKNISVSCSFLARKLTPAG